MNIHEYRSIKYLYSFHKNSLNSDSLSPLDVAVLSNNRSLTKMLIQHGAIEGNKCMYNFFHLHPIK